MKKAIAFLLIVFSMTVSAQSFDKLKFESAKTSYQLADSSWSFVIRNNSDTIKIDLYDSLKTKFIKYNGKTKSLKDLFKKDTVIMIGYLIDRFDTSIVPRLSYIKNKKVKSISPGYVVMKRQAITFDGRNYQWADKYPTFVCGLDNKKRPVKNLITTK